MASKAKTVLLLKAEDSENTPDPYIEKLKECDISASIIPTLEFTFINDGILQHYLSYPNEFDGLIFTSPRTVRAVHRVCEFKGFTTNLILVALISNLCSGFLCNIIWHREKFMH
ncbi:hypothetical protein CDAR_542793 [Caerostris darwini]|uniref:Uroporphyrinogen-III synthase n=1 Tax=Caerostris darwini TaxID=1538125 RepID=A0AAV4WY17_9ARAC|nr:hypothetical protein CDAR_542793 [Caerostris darwini]